MTGRARPSFAPWSSIVALRQLSFFLPTARTHNRKKVTYATSSAGVGLVREVFAWDLAWRQASPRRFRVGPRARPHRSPGGRAVWSFLN